MRRRFHAANHAGEPARYGLRTRWKGESASRPIGTREVDLVASVLAEDISDSELIKLKEHLGKEGLQNVEVIKGDKDDPKLPADRLDAALIVNAAKAPPSISQAPRDAGRAVTARMPCVVVKGADACADRERVQRYHDWSKWRAGTRRICRAGGAQRNPPSAPWPARRVAPALRLTPTAG